MISEENTNDTSTSASMRAGTEISPLEERAGLLRDAVVISCDS